MKIVIKVGTQSILNAQGRLCDTTLRALTRQIAQVQRAGHRVILVSSGAVAAGRTQLRSRLGKEYGGSVAQQQLLASLGQHELLHRYAILFDEHDLMVSQLLLTRQDFYTRQHYHNIARLLGEVLAQEAIIPIVNENDSVAVEELMFTDNDELAALIAAQIDADKLIILSNVDGIYSTHPEEEGATLISEIATARDCPEVCSLKSTHGRGGMRSKLAAVQKVSALGISCHVASAHHPDVICKILKNKPIGTRILPGKRKSSIKKWMAFRDEKKAASITINPTLSTILREKKRITSILPLGIIRVEGAFKRGDILDVISDGGEKLAVGIARYDARELAGYLGKQGQPALIHYDYLHVF